MKKKTTTRISDALTPKKKDYKMVNIKSDPDIYDRLKAKLKKKRVTVKDFFETSAKIYLDEN